MYFVRCKVSRKCNIIKHNGKWINCIEICVRMFGVWQTSVRARALSCMCLIEQWAPHANQTTMAVTKHISHFHNTSHVSGSLSRMCEMREIYTRKHLFTKTLNVMRGALVREERERKWTKSQKPLSSSTPPPHTHHSLLQLCKTCTGPRKLSKKDLH